MGTITLTVIGKVFYFAAIVCGSEQPCDQNFKWVNEFPTVEACLADEDRRIEWLQTNYKFKYAEPPKYICSETFVS